jgi:hypothetical protein
LLTFEFILVGLQAFAMSLTDAAVEQDAVTACRLPVARRKQHVSFGIFGMLGPLHQLRGKSLSLSGRNADAMSGIYRFT